MYPTTAGHEDNIHMGRRPISQTQTASMLASAPTFWDEPTVVVREGPQTMKKHDGTDLSPKSTTGNSLPPKNRTEIYACTSPGCQRKFVNQAELRNHVDVLHFTDQDDPESSASDQQSEDIEQKVSLDDDTSSLYPISQRSASQDGEKTIKPIPITAAALQALNSNDESDLTYSMHELSISGSDGHASSVSLMSVDTTYSVMEEYEDVALSEVAEANTPSIQLPVHILLVLWGKFFYSFFARNRSTFRQNAPYRAAQDQRNPDLRPNENSATPSQTPSIVSIASSARVSKRKENFDDDEEENNGRRPSKIRPPRAPTTIDNPALACPFNKYDSFIFGGDANNPAYHVCSTWHDVKTAYLKQHIIRNHCLPEYHCQRCGDDFKNDKNLRNHYRMDPPCELKEIDTQKLMLETQLELGLRSRNAVSTDRTTYWYKVYDTIFGSEARRQRPVEPFYKGPSHEVLESFLHFSERRIPDVIRQSRQMLNLDPEDYNEQNVQLVRTILQEASQSFMTERRSGQAQSLKDIQKQNTLPDDEVDDLGERTVTVEREKQSLVDRSAVGKQEPALPSWSQSIDDFTQPSDEAFHQPLPHSSSFAQDQLYDPSTVALDATLAQNHLGPNDYDQSANFSYSMFTADNFDHAPFLNDPEFLATMEDPDLYGTGSIDPNDIGAYESSGMAFKRDRKLP